VIGEFIAARCFITGSPLSSLGVISIVLADDNLQIRYRIRQILRQAGDIIILGEANNGEEAIDLVDQCEPRIALLDIEMPVLDGIDTARALKRSHPQVQTIILSSYADRYFIQMVLEEGCAGYIVKEHAPRTLVNTIRSTVGEHPLVTN
jgi:DNA-binding NarL/FixJ family response regulator